MVAGQTFELRHYGVKGMKWGHRKAPKEYAKLDSLKKDYKNAKKEYNRAFNKAYNRSIAAWSPIKKHRQANDARWENAADKAKALNDAKKAYKDQKKEVRKNTTIGQKIGRAAPKVGKALQVVGTLYVADVTLTGGAVTRGAYKAGKTAVKNAMSKVGDSLFKYSVLDASGKVLKRFN